MPQFKISEKEGKTMDANNTKANIDDQLEPIYNSSVPIQDVALKTNRERWKGGGRGSERSMLASRHHDDDDDR